MAATFKLSQYAKVTAHELAVHGATQLYGQRAGRGAAARKTERFLHTDGEALQLRTNVARRDFDAPRRGRREV